MRRGTYSIQKLVKVDTDGGVHGKLRNKSEVEASLTEISLFDLSGTYLLPEAKTRVDVSENSDEIILHISTSKEEKVEKPLIELLGHFGAELTEGSDVRITSCYVATKVYGDSNHPNVQTLRVIKDKEFSRSMPGRAFTRWYYGGGGQRAADFIEKVPFGRRVTRVALDVYVACKREGLKSLCNS